MLSGTSIAIKPEAFLSVSLTLAEDRGADLFLSGAGWPHNHMNYVGLGPAREMILKPPVSTDEVAAFAFSDSVPTFGFIGYTAGLSGSPGGAEVDCSLPAAHLKKYQTLLMYDSRAHKLTITAVDRNASEEAKAMVEARRVTRLPGHRPALECTSLHWSLDREGYLERVGRILDYIRRGHVYQLNLSIEFRAVLAHLPGPELFFFLLNQYPAPYYAWFRTGPFQVLSTSPEQFLKVRDGNVTSQPIKGTLRFAEYHQALTRRLTQSPKEEAELSMIVDLIRNDLSENCAFGSVRVREHKAILAVDNLLQMYSTVGGRLKPSSSCVHLLLDAFPGGSVTGCPKRRAMELIDELEPHSRGVYCGSLFVIFDQRNMDSSIAIRTGYLDNTRREFRFYAGSGIVVASDAESEYRETLSKAHKFLSLLDVKSSTVPAFAVDNLRRE